MKNEYRILEHQGLFYIQEKVIINYDVFHLIDGYIRMMGVFIVITFPYTFWILYKHRNYKSTYEKWITASIGQSIGRVGKINIPVYPCITLDEAKELLKLINTPDKIHYVESI